MIKSEQTVIQVPGFTPDQVKLFAEKLILMGGMKLITGSGREAEPERFFAGFEYDKDKHFFLSPRHLKELDGKEDDKTNLLQKLFTGKRKMPESKSLPPTSELMKLENNSPVEVRRNNMFLQIFTGKKAEAEPVNPYKGIYNFARMVAKDFMDQDAGSTRIGNTVNYKVTCKYAIFDIEKILKMAGMERITYNNMQGSLQQEQKKIENGGRQ